MGLACCGLISLFTDNNDDLCSICFSCVLLYYSAQRHWFNIILLGYIINAVVVVALYTIALFPSIYIKLSRILVKVLTKLHILKNPEKTLDSWTLQVHEFYS